ncbi:MAG: DUF1189 family protein [Carnobacterium sp.]|uniref:DUF1189 family protein n=1 Tax=Carnobacterium antarcticum TaxID=2126436 RepID=A0ABW4NRY1_9LACT|nr:MULTISPECIES: DUF1189 family protein [unclassified Carnobacterium]ALV21360.1 Maltodextrose utilization protein MalA [Carnobacterium sp. CP1]QQP69373.1 DUF1189 family protein [Carnobacterium sp. CS13]
MKTDQFPLNYFKSIWTPKGSFKGRHQLNWFQLIVVLFFVNGLLMIPVALNYVKMDHYPIEGSYPHAFGLIDESVVSELNQAAVTAGTLQIDNEVEWITDNGIVSVNVSDSAVQQSLKAENALVFSENGFYLKDGDLPVSKIQYTKDFDLSNATSVQKLKAALSRQWFVQNRLYVVGSLMLLVFSILLISTIFIVFGSAVFLYLTKKSSFSSIKTYKESVNIIENAIGLPTLVALISAVVQFDVVVMLTIQSLGLVLMILMIFYQTRFNDKTIPNKGFGNLGGKMND